MATFYDNNYQAARNTYSQHNPVSSELTQVLMKIGDDRRREAYQKATMAEQAREADQQNTYRESELQARKDAEAKYYQSKTGDTDTQKAETAARAQFAARGLQQDLKQKESDFSLYTGHVNAITQKLMKAGVQPQQLQDYLDGTAKAPPLLEADVKLLSKAIGLQQKTAADADATVSQYNREFGLGVLLGVDRTTGRFKTTAPYIPYQGLTSGATSPATSPSSGVVGGGGSGGVVSAPGAAGGGGGGGVFFGPPAPPTASAPRTAAASEPEEPTAFGLRPLYDAGAAAAQAVPSAASAINRLPAKALWGAVDLTRQQFGGSPLPTPEQAAERRSVLEALSRPMPSLIAPVGGTFNPGVSSGDWRGYPAPTPNEIAAATAARDARAAAASVTAPIVSRPAATPRYFRSNYTDTYLDQLGVPSGFSAEAAQRPPTNEEIAAATAVRNARLGRVRQPAFFGPPMPNPWDYPAQTYGPQSVENPGYPPGYFQQ